jgi:hypothetical protein
MTSHRECFDWPQRPQRQGALSAQPTPAAPAQAAAGVPGGEVLAPLLTLAAISLVPVAFVYAAWILIEAMTRAPFVFVIVGAAMLFAGLIAWALCRAAAEPWRIEDDDILVISPQFDLRLER